MLRGSEVFRIYVWVALSLRQSKALAIVMPVNVVLVLVSIFNPATEI